MDPLIPIRERLQHGQGFEERGTVDGCAAAIGCYREALALLQPELAGGGTEADYLHGVVWMNLGNGLRRKGTPSGQADAIHAYDRAIAIFGHDPDVVDGPRRNSLGAAWLNRGVALHRQGPGATVTEALRSFRAAGEILQPLPLEGNSWYRCNRAAALMNLGNALLDSDEPDRFEAARTAARSAVGLVSAGSNHVTFAELALKARRVWCDALGQLLPRARGPAAVDALADEAGDVVDAGLVLWRRWAEHPELQDVARRLFRFGAQLHRMHQPQFFAEFLEENLQALRTSPGREVPAREFAAVAREEIERFLVSLQEFQPFDLMNPRHQRLLEAARAGWELQARWVDVGSG
jgi:hypothetical protein